MIKLIHLIFVVSSLASFVSRFSLSIVNPKVLQRKLFKIAPHIIDTLLLVSGLTLVIQGHWLDGEWGWIGSKLILLVTYVVLGVIAMKSTGQKRWIAFLLAISCYVSIFIIAITKQGFI